MAAIGAEKPVMQNVIGEKEKWINKENSKHEDTDSFLHNRKVISNVVLNFKILGAVVPENSLTEKKLTHRQSHRPTLLRERQKLYSPYILHMPGIQVITSSLGTQSAFYVNLYRAVIGPSG